MNTNFTVNHAKEYLDKHNNVTANKVFFRYFSYNINLTAEFVQEHAKKGWDWAEIAGNEFEKNKYYKGGRK